MDTFLLTLVGFLSGSIPFSVLVTKLRHGLDARDFGDSNPGAANAWKAGGWQTGLIAVALDFLKGAVPVALAQLAAGISGLALIPVALAPVVGHAFSPFLRFHGGKAVATTFGIWTGLTAWWGPAVLAILLLFCWTIQKVDAWVVVLGLVAMLPVLLLFKPEPYLFVVWAGNTAVVYWKHRHDLGHPAWFRLFPNWGGN